MITTIINTAAAIIGTLLTASLIALGLVAGVLICLGLLNLICATATTLWRGHL